MFFGDDGSEMVVVVVIEIDDGVQNVPCVWMGTVGTTCCNMGGLGAVKNASFGVPKNAPECGSVFLLLID